MKKFDVSTDSTCDLIQSYIKENDVWFVSLTYTIEQNGQTEFVKDKYSTNADCENFYNRLRNKAVARTAMLNLQDHLDHFENLAKNGVKEVVHFTISYALSPTLDVANQAYEIIKEKYPDFKLYAIESHSTTIGQGILVKIAVEMRNNGATAEETYNYINEIKHKLQVWFMVDDLNFLKRGGRVSAASAVVGTLLGIKPILTFNEKGALSVIKKEKGRKNAIKFMAEQMRNFTYNKNCHLSIVHSGNEKYAEELKDALMQVTDITPEVSYIGPVIGCHVGPDAVGFAFVSNENRPKVD